MEHASDRNHAAVPSDGRVPATQPAESTARPPATLDAHGFDPNDFDWRPVPRRPRKDGWTPEIQTAFIEALARTGVVDHACREVDRSVSSAYTLRHAPGAESFARAWEAVLTRAADRVLDIAMAQPIVGEEVPVFDQDGVRTGSKWKYNTRMAQFLLRAYHPERFRHAHRDTRQPDEAPPPPAPPMAEVIASLSPVTPAEPHLLVPPATLAAAVTLADHDAAKAEAAPADNGYRVDPAPPTHPRVRKRADRNQERRARREEREEYRYGFGDADPDEDRPENGAPDGSHLKPGDPAFRWPPDYTYWLAQNPEAAVSIPPALAARPKRARKRSSLNFPSTSKSTDITQGGARSSASPQPPITNDGDTPDDQSV